MANEETLVTIKTHELRALLFWASCGVCESRGGSYEEKIVEIIRSKAEEIDYPVPRNLGFVKRGN